MPNGENASAPQEGAIEQQAATRSLDDLPDEYKWAATEITELRTQSARYRTERNEERALSAELKASLEGAVSAEDHAAAISEWDGKVKTMTRERIIEKHKLPEDLAELLKGDDEASLAEHAAKLAKYVPAEQATPPESAEPPAHTPPPLPPSGGRDPGAPADDVDPADLVKQAKQQGFR